MNKPLRIIGQFAVIAVLFAAVAAFADWPVYRQIPKGSGIVMLSFVHGADRKAQCRTLTPEELAKLAPNMRRAQDCPRGRQPIYVELDIDGATVYKAVLPPSGIARDGPSQAYQKFVWPTGRHGIAVRMRDNPSTRGFDYERKAEIALAPGQVFVIDFQMETNGFVFR